ncbi:MAG TPA: metallophosphoesterase [Polyangiaceae bacterium]|nr:metallophosphoesterase [Polyangiaceae bacterium]
MASTTDHVDRASTHPRRRARVSRFLRILVAITAAMHVPVALGVGELARRCGWPAAPLVGWAWAATGVVLFVGRARAGMPDRRRPAALVRAVDVPYFIHWCAALWALIPSVVATIVAPAVEAVLGQHVRLPVAGYMYFYLSGLVVAGYGTLVRRRWVRVVEREVPLAGLDARLDGTRIAHLSDLHVGTLTPRAWGLSWSAKANLCRPDLAVVTGDMLTSGTDFHEDVADVVGALRAKHGVFASMGNHDYFGEGEPLISLLRARGVRVLRNEGTTIERDGAKLWVAAIDDTWTRRDDIALALRDRPADATAVLLAHDPQRFDQAADAGADLVLSGHTHGGQVAMPFVYRAINLARFGYRYTVGFYRRGRSVLYVHPGLGTTGPPIRLGVAPEVTILVLRSA